MRRHYKHEEHAIYAHGCFNCKYKKAARLRLPWKTLYFWRCSGRVLPARKGGKHHIQVCEKWRRR